MVPNKEWYEQYKYDVGDRWHETNRLFISEDGKVTYPGTISYWVHKICDQAGCCIERCTRYDTPISPCRSQQASRW